jgi:Holliday junction resolvase RusA-like endonuclease
VTQRIEAITVAAPGKSITMNHRMNRWDLAAANKNWRDAGFWWAKQHRLVTRGADGPVEVWFEFGVKDPKKRRDPHNWYPTIKAILDGFTTAAVWVDDDSEHVKTYEPTFIDTIPPNHLRITLTWRTHE